MVTPATVPVVPRAPPAPTASLAQNTMPAAISIPNGVKPAPTKPVANGSVNAGRVPPPAPPTRAPAPPPPSAPQRDQYRCLFDFSTAEAGEVSLIKGEIVELIKQEETGGLFSQLCSASFKTAL